MNRIIKNNENEQLSTFRNLLCSCGEVYILLYPDWSILWLIPGALSPMYFSGKSEISRM